MAAGVVVAFVAWRLRNGRIGRAWIAIREDEDVAEAEEAVGEAVSGSRCRVTVPATA